LIEQLLPGRARSFGGRQVVLLYGLIEERFCIRRAILPGRGATGEQN
jgi:hypothetical protein